MNHDADTQELNGISRRPLAAMHKQQQCHRARKLHLGIARDQQAGAQHCCQRVKGPKISRNLDLVFTAAHDRYGCGRE